MLQAAPQQYCYKKNRLQLHQNIEIGRTEV